MVTWGFFTLGLAIGAAGGVWIAWMVWRERFWQFEFRHAAAAEPTVEEHAAALRRLYDEFHREMEHG